MFIYKSKYNSDQSLPLKIEKSLIIQDTKEYFNFVVLVIPINAPLYMVVADDSYFLQLQMVDDKCNIFIMSKEFLSRQHINLIEDFISHNVSETKPIPEPIPIRCIGKSTSAIDSFNYNNITLHFNSFTNNYYNFINYVSNDPEHIHIHDSRICYKKLHTRMNADLIHGKVNGFTRGVNIFQWYPMLNTPTVYILPNEFSILKRSNNRVAFINVDNYYFWLVTDKHSFLNDNLIDSDNSALYKTSAFCSTNLNQQSLNAIFNVFKKYNFNNYIINESAIVAEDIQSSLLFYTGVCKTSDYSQYSKCFDLLF
ncbi:hypothetical protein MrNuV_ORF047 [Macrobrachium rosenbergii nudivirus]|nr:hypothetical protein MrNuV_ORF047 [Macrobrachium rosenbergii nudivirus]